MEESHQEKTIAFKQHFDNAYLIFNYDEHVLKIIEEPQSQPGPLYEIEISKDQIDEFTKGLYKDIPTLADDLKRAMEGVNVNFMLQFVEHKLMYSKSFMHQSKIKRIDFVFELQAQKRIETSKINKDLEQRVKELELKVKSMESGLLGLQKEGSNSLSIQNQMREDFDKKFELMMNVNSQLSEKIENIQKHFEKNLLNRPDKDIMDQQFNLKDPVFLKNVGNIENDEKNLIKKDEDFSLEKRILYIENVVKYNAQIGEPEVKWKQTENEILSIAKRISPLEEKSEHIMKEFEDFKLYSSNWKLSMDSFTYKLYDPYEDGTLTFSNNNKTVKYSNIHNKKKPKFIGVAPTLFDANRSIGFKIVNKKGKFMVGISNRSYYNYENPSEMDAHLFGDMIPDYQGLCFDEELIIVEANSRDKCVTWSMGGEQVYFKDLDYEFRSFNFCAFLEDDGEITIFKP